MHSSYTDTVEDYLKAIYELQREQGKVTTNALAERLAVSAASAAVMNKKLAGMGLVAHEPYQGVTLTGPGRAAALEIIRHHRLVELYLVEKLGLSREQAHLHAETWEHTLSEELEARLDELLGHPTVDSHGAPIPTPAGDIAPRPVTRLSELAAGQTGIVAEFQARDPALVSYLETQGLRPGVRVMVAALAAPFADPVTVRVEDGECIIGRNVAKQVFVVVEQGNGVCHQE
jgi:DtxR family Mn-dependent transcriptional regulator